MKIPDKEKLPEKFKRLIEDKNIFKNSVYFKIIDESPAKIENFPDNIESELLDALTKVGIKTLYSHQYRAFNLLTQRKNIIATTPTASGKSLIYTLYIFNTIIKSKKVKSDSPKALFIFPTKALSEDQLLNLEKINSNLPKKLRLKIYRYDGDTPDSLRPKIRLNSDIIITNPDMLHNGILPNHTKWLKIFLNLEFVVIDEVHTYKGIFGSHFALVIERLKRILKFYQNKKNIPQFILLSATIGNALEFGQKLISEKLELINQSGAKSYKKYFLFYNPPKIKDLDIRIGLVPSAVQIGKLLFKNGIQSIIFMPSRLYVELVQSWLKKSINEFSHKIGSYRGGYLPEERKKITQKLKNKEIMIIIATNALELGIDIGDFESSIIASFPGSISSFFQRAGRAGRKGEALIIFIASNFPIDQYLMDNPEYFFQTDIEKIFINPLNEYIYNAHLKCALFELPFLKDELFYNLNPSSFFEYFIESKIASFSENKFFYSAEGYPAENISLRSATNENVVIVDITDNKNEIIGELDLIGAYSLLYPKAIYIHQDKIYQVKELNLKESKALVTISKANYYTDALMKTDIKVLNILLSNTKENMLQKDKVMISKELKSEEFKINNIINSESNKEKFSSSFDPKNIKPNNFNINKSVEEKISKFFIDALIRTTPTKFKKLKFFTNENIGWGEINLPPLQIHTEALYIGFKNIPLHIKNDQISFYAEIITSIGYLSENILPFYLNCDRNDIGIAETVKNRYFNYSGFYIYDKVPGGINLSREAYNLFPDIFKFFVKRIENCSCENGCPSCIGTGYKFINKLDVKRMLLNSL